MKMAEDEDSIVNEEERAKLQFTDEETMEFGKLPIHNSRHLKALNISAKINGRLVSRVLVNGGLT